MVSYIIDDSVLQLMDQSISKYISSGISKEILGNTLTYHNFRRHDSVYSDLIWDSLSKNALGIEVKFIGQKDFHIVIGQDNGRMGSILQNKNIDFKFIVPKNKIKGNPEPIISFVKYKCAWHYSNPKYWKLLPYKIPKSNLTKRNM